MTVLSAFTLGPSNPWARQEHDDSNEQADDSVALTETRTSHAIIKITSNGNGPTGFSAGNGVNSGAGTSGNPWVINNWEINANSGSYAIWIESTTDYFVIKNCGIRNATSSFSTKPYASGIYLESVQNGKIEDNTIALNCRGIYAMTSSKNVITNNRFTNNTPNGVELDGSTYNTIILNKGWSNGYGAYLHGVSNNNKVQDNNFSKNDFGIFLQESKYNNITRNNCHNNTSDGVMVRYWSDENNITLNNATGNGISGIMLCYFSQRNNVSSNNCSKNANNGVYLRDSDNNDILNNILRFNAIQGIQMTWSDGCKVRSNNISHNKDIGIKLQNSMYANITGNTMLQCGIMIFGESLTEWNTHYISQSNMANGKPVLYLKNLTSGTVTQSAGQIILANCNHIAVSSQSVANVSAGMLLGFCASTNVTNVTSNDNQYYGIYLSHCSDLDLKGNSVSRNKFAGIEIYNSSYVEAANNTARGNQDGIYLHKAQYCIMEHNLAQDNDLGLHLADAHRGGVTNNTGTGNSAAGLALDSCGNNTVKQNDMSDNKAMGIWFTLSHYNTIASNAAINNTSEGIYGYESSRNTVFNNTARSNGKRGIYLSYSCKFNTVDSNMVSENNWSGIGLYSAQRNTISGNNVSQNVNHGIILDHSSNNTVTKNLLWRNNWTGVYTVWSDTNSITLNDIEENAQYGVQIGFYCLKNQINRNNFLYNNGSGKQASNDLGLNYWNTSLSGNYWSDWDTPDADRNGIVDVQYDFDGTIFAVDYLPLAIMVGKVRLATMDKNSTYEDAYYSVQYSLVQINGPPTMVVWNLTTNATWLNMDSYGFLYGTPENGDVGQSWVNVSVSAEPGNFDFSNFTLTVLNVNDAPTILTGNYTNCTEDGFFEMNLSAVDIDPTNDPLTWNMTTDVSFLLFNATAGYLNGTPDNTDVGLHWMELTVSDGQGGWDTLNVTLEVLNVNDPPVITTLDVNVSIQDTLYSVNYEATDIDPTNDLLNWSLLTNAPFLSINHTTGVLSGRPANDDVSIYWVNVSVNDGNGGGDRTNFTLTVLNKNDPPYTISPLVNVTFAEDTPYKGINLTTWFGDPDGDVLAFSAVGYDYLTVDILPNGTVVLTPPANWSGTDSVLFFANDSKEQVFWDLSVRVTPVNDAPFNASITVANLTYIQGREQPASGSGQDVDLPYKDILIYTWYSNISGQVASGNSVNLSLKAGLHNVTLRVSDLGNLWTEAWVVINVSLPPKANITNITDDDIDPNITDDDKPQNNNTDDGNMKLMIIIIIAAGVLLLLIIIIVAVVTRPKPKKRPQGPEGERDPYADERRGRDMYEGDRNARDGHASGSQAPPPDYGQVDTSMFEAGGAAAQTVDEGTVTDFGVEEVVTGENADTEEGEATEGEEDSFASYNEESPEDEGVVPVAAPSKGKSQRKKPVDETQDGAEIEDEAETKDIYGYDEDEPVEKPKAKPKAAPKPAKGKPKQQVQEDDDDLQASFDDVDEEDDSWEMDEEDEEKPNNYMSIDDDE